MSLSLIVLLVVATVLMCIPIGMQMKWYEVPRWKAIPVSLMLVLTGVYGSNLWYFVENGNFMGRSLYGVIFFAPLVYWPLSKILKIPYLSALDFCAPAGCMTLAAVKLQCLRDNCCQGMILYIDENYFYVRFPSQIVEFVAFLIISCVLMRMSKNDKYREQIFPWFLVIYGAARFVLNFFRDIIEPYALGLGAGSFWSIWAFIAGLVWLYRYKKKNHVSVNVQEA